jgi:hypothetical protein
MVDKPETEIGPVANFRVARPRSTRELARVLLSNDDLALL